MRLDEFIAQLEAAGWRSQLDAQHQRITELWRAEYPGAASYLDALEETRAENERLLGAVQRAYGYLWHVNNEPGAPNQYAPEQAAYAARRELRELLTHEQRGEGGRMKCQHGVDVFGRCAPCEEGAYLILISELKAELAAAWAEIERMTGELASANRECEVRNERELGYLARAQSAEAELEALRADGKETVALDARQFQQRARAQEITDEQ